MADKSIVGLRGFIVKIVNSDHNLKSTISSFDSYWPFQKSDKVLSPWNSLHFQYGMQPWFDDSREEYDIDSLVNSCYNLAPFCGESKNKLINPNKIEIIDRGIGELLYFPQAETKFRR